MYISEENRQLGSLMKKTFIVFCLLLLSAAVPAQVNRLPMDRQRLLLELSSGFYNVLSLGQINLDSSLIAASTSLKMHRSPVILDGFENAFQGNDISWIEKRDLNTPKALLKKLQGSEHTKLLLLIGAYYTFQSGKNTADADSALAYLFKARHESEIQNSKFWLNQTLILISKSYLKKWNTAKGYYFTKQVIENCKAPGDESTLAKAYYYYAAYAPFIPDSTALRISLLEKSAKLYHGLRNFTGEIISVTYYTYLTFASGDVPRSTAGAHRALLLQDSIKFPYTQFIQDQLAYISEVTGDHITSLTRALSEVETAERTKLDFQISLFYLRLGTAYENLDYQDPKAEYYFRKAFDAAMKNGGLSIGLGTLDFMVAKAFQRKNPAEAFQLISRFVARFPPGNLPDQQTLYMILGDSYSKMNNRAAAEKNYLSAVALEPDVVKITNSQGGKAYYRLGHFYTGIGAFEKAKPYLDQYVANPSHTVPDLAFASDAQKDLSKIDSARGDYATAYQHLLKHVDLYDKVYNTTQLKALEGLKIKYETREKEQSIRLLQAKGQLDQTQLQKVGLQRNLTLGGILTLFLISGLVYNGYRNKRKSNLILNRQQKEINDKNLSLEQTLVEKDHLLSDKDLLLKEVNHRVKNNLHMVMSLLESQTAYLDNNAALEAIQDSQNRVQSIALIHQKLYSSENITQVDMQSYIPELIDYLNDAINTKRQSIVISHQIAPVMLDVSQAIPIGLILNEGITNAIKHAFTTGQNGEIVVTMKLTGDKLFLQLRDNGIGLPMGFKIENTRSLGLNLMKGLTNQLKGTFKIEGRNGVTITISVGRLVF